MVLVLSKNKTQEKWLSDAPSHFSPVASAPLTQLYRGQHILL